jgi:hypothetical protein
MRRLHSEVGVLSSCVADDGSAYFTLVERTDNRGYRIHQLELLPFHIVGEQAARIGREFKESAVELAGEFSTESIRDLTMSHKCQKAMSRRARTSTDHRLSYSR